VVCSNPWNLDAGSLALQRTWLGREVYSKTMGTNMKRLVEIHHDQVSKNSKLDLEKIRHVKYLHEVDSLLASRIPIFAINAEDDPVSTYQESST
jgi:predicted alpha/beta-fold hydrolase